MLPALSEIELLRFRRKPSCVMLSFIPSEIDISRIKSLAFEDAIMRVAGIPAELLRGVSPERARDIAETHARYTEREQSNV